MPSRQPPANHRAEKLLERIEWTSLKRLDGFVQGDFRTVFRGWGIDLAGLREYELSDDVRHIDWNVTARMMVPYIRRYNEDRDVTVWFLADVSPSMHFGSSQRTKLDVARELVGLLGALFVRHGNRVGLAGFDNNSLTIYGSGTGRKHLLLLLDRLLPAKPGPARKTNLAAGRTDLAGGLRRLSGLVQRRSIIVLLSDLFSPGGWEKHLGMLALKNELLVARLVDPMERALPRIGFVLMGDPETGEQILVDTNDRGFRRRFQAESLERESAIRGALSRAAADAVEFSTAADVVDTLIRYISLRSPKTAAAAGRRA